jgi:hypothetical protein
VITRSHIDPQGEKFITGFVRKPEGREHIKQLGIDGRVVLNWMLKVG